MRRKRSSSAAATISPSRLRHAAESQWNSLMPRIVVTSPPRKTWRGRHCSRQDALHELYVHNVRNPIWTMSESHTTDEELDCEQSRDCHCNNDLRCMAWNMLK